MARKSASVTRRLTVVAAVVFIFGPALVYLGGARPARFENRALARFPAMSDGWSWFTALPGWATDNLPLRERAVRANGRINSSVFGDRTSARVGTATLPGGWPQVISGKDGNLFYGGDLRNACLPALSPVQIIRHLQRLDRLLRASGRTLVVVAAPDKSDFLADKMPDRYRGKACAQSRNAQMWTLADRLRSFVDLRGALQDVAKLSPYPVYLPRDTHWDGAGGAAFVRAVVARIQPAVLSSFSPRALPPQRLPADLATLSGGASTSVRHTVLLEAPGTKHEFTAITEPRYTPQVFRSTGAPGTLVTVPTLAVGDSFLSASQPCLAGVFADLTELHQASATLARAVLVRAIVNARAVIVEVVERDLFSGWAHVLQTPFLDALATGLAGHRLAPVPSAGHK